jgi:PIN domain nuclease of toxin-antitoxin system
MGAVLDTHTVLWYVLRSRRLSRAATQAIRSALSRGKRIYISAISIVETTYLVERGAFLGRPFRSSKRVSPMPSPAWKSFPWTLRWRNP